jgi:hypothetical protein
MRVENVYYLFRIFYSYSYKLPTLFLGACFFYAFGDSHSGDSSDEKKKISTKKTTASLKLSISTSKCKLSYFLV